MNELTAARLRELLSYDQGTGVFTWRVRMNNLAAGAVAGCLGSRGYWRIKVNKRIYQAHRLAWLYVHGLWPNGDIDHVDGERANNVISNLRDVSQSVNGQNQRRAHSKNKSSGLLGVSANRGRWRAQILVAGKNITLGRFDTPELAYSAYLAAKREHHAGCTI